MPCSKKCLLVDIPIEIAKDQRIKLPIQLVDLDYIPFVSWLMFNSDIYPCIEPPQEPTGFELGIKKPIQINPKLKKHLDTFRTNHEKPQNREIMSSLFIMDRN
jgi:hypothetical protein